MAEGKSKQYPYRSLGFKLRSLREKEQETIPDVSGAVEIDSEILIDIESGLKLPSEDILLLLISHFALPNDEAMKLWRLAGYDNLTEPQQAGTESYGQQPAVFILPIDSRIVYTDNAQITSNKSGVVINFQQNNNSPSTQPLNVSRLGMSKEQAQALITKLQKAIKVDFDKSNSTKDKLDEKNKKQKENKWPGSQD